MGPSWRKRTLREASSDAYSLGTFLVAIDFPVTLFGGFIGVFRIHGPFPVILNTMV